MLSCKFCPRAGAERRARVLNPAGDLKYTGIVTGTVTEHSGIQNHPNSMSWMVEGRTSTVLLVIRMRET